jgi:acid phosphatase type 7
MILIGYHDMSRRWLYLFVVALICIGCSSNVTPTADLVAIQPTPTFQQQAAPATAQPVPPTEIATITFTVPPIITVNTPPSTLTPTPAPVIDPVFVGAGDIAGCDSSGAESTAALLDAISGTVFTLGDNAYPSGTAAEFAKCYDPTWGRHKARTHPAPGNHDYVTSGAASYFTYFGPSAGDASKGYYSFDLGAWHVISLNSNCWAVGGCGKGSPQYQWLAADLSAHPTLCTLAYWHHPRFSSGPHGNSVEVLAFWQLLYDAGVDVVLNGHDHNYERFAPQNPNGISDKQHGIREFVVGTGGYSHYAIGSVVTNSQVHNSDTYGVLKLTLSADRYSWEFIPESGKSFRDAGTDVCH